MIVLGLMAADLHPDGQRTAAAAVVALTATMVWILQREVGERTQLARRVVADATRFEAMLEHSHDVISVLTAEGVPTYMSPGVRTVFGYEVDSLVGRDVVAELIHPDDLQEALEALGSLLDAGGGSAGHLHARIRHADGRWLHTESIATNLLDDEAVQGIVLNTRDITDRVEAEEAFRWQARHDPLTGLANRTQLIEGLEGAFNRRRLGHTEHVAVLFLDLDGFKAVNDAHGHAIGDQLLVDAARRITDSVRPGDTVARLGGDEFVVVAERLNGHDDSVLLAQRILAVLAAPFELGDGCEATCTASIGVALLDAHSADTVLQAADDALYRAKRRGRNRFESAASATSASATSGTG
jgi:diguanylate cyclase (GGDEF)-like protein/PAS domain S-box-containing protein